MTVSIFATDGGDDHDNVRHGMKLQRLRNARDLTQSDVAKELGCSRQTVIRWERGENEPTEYAAALAALYGVPVSEVMRPVQPPAEGANQATVRRLAAEVADLQAWKARVEKLLDPSDE